MEAANSLNLTFKHPSGYTAMLTIRSENSGDLLQRFEKLLAWLRENGCQPAPRAETIIQTWPQWMEMPAPKQGQPADVALHDSANVVPAHSGIVTVSSGSGKAPALPDGSPDPAWCSIHQVTMKRRESNGQVWYSHKVGDGWCKGKPPKNGNGH